MTRMWLLPPSILCTDHLNGEHNELHKLVGSIRNHPHGNAIAQGHVAKGNIDTTLINQRHEQLVKEMDRRGWNHESPLSYDSNETQYGEGCIDYGENLLDLYDRCPDCAARIESTPLYRWLSSVKV